MNQGSPVRFEVPERFHSLSSTTHDAHDPGAGDHAQIDTFVGRRRRLA